MSLIAAATPAAPAIRAADVTLTYAALDRLSSECGLRLHHAGIIRGTRVAVVAPNTVEHIVLIVALLRIGAVYCPLSPRFPAAVTAKIFADISPDLVVSPDTDRLPAGMLSMSLAELVPTFRAVDSAPSRFIEIDPNSPATIMITSGTTGHGKAVLHRYASHWYSAHGAGENMPLGPGDSWLLSLPLYHVGGFAILMRCFIAGATVALSTSMGPIADVVADYAVTHLSLVPTQLRRILEHEGNRIACRNLKHILLGGDVIPAFLVESAVGAGLPVHTTYGLTEMASQVTTSCIGDPDGASQSAGYVLPHRELKISPGGEIMVRGATLFYRYVGEAAAPPRIDSDGWFHSGDLGRLDDAGRLLVIGRRDNMFISGGENVHPEAIEAYLAGLANVVEAIIVPIADREFGSRPIAFVKMRSGCRLDSAAIRVALRDSLPSFMVPVGFYPWPADMADVKTKTCRKRLQRLGAERSGA